jgi:hypothetical protein
MHISVNDKYLEAEIDIDKLARIMCTWYDSTSIVRGSERREYTILTPDGPMETDYMTYKIIGDAHSPKEGGPTPLYFKLALIGRNSKHYKLSESTIRIIYKPTPDGAGEWPFVVKYGRSII